MAVEFIGFFSVLLFFLSSCKAKLGNYSEAQCKVLPVGKGTASEFRVEASEKGVRIIYLDLKFSNDSYRPLESENEFLPNRWVWASLISEPMLSMSYDYDILSMGLLKYQTRSMDVLLKDQPSGCLANLKSSYQNKVVGRALLSMTQINSGEPSDKNVVCVAMIENFLWSSFEGNVKFQCCKMRKDENTGSASIQCELDVQVSGWFQAFNGTLNLLTEAQRQNIIVIGQRQHWLADHIRPNPSIWEKLVFRLQWTVAVVTELQIQVDYSNTLLGSLNAEFGRSLLSNWLNPRVEVKTHAYFKVHNNTTEEIDCGKRAILATEFQQWKVGERKKIFLPRGWATVKKKERGESWAMKQHASPGPLPFNVDSDSKLNMAALVGSIKFFTCYGIEKRDRTPFIALWVLFWDFVSVIVVGGIFGGICLCLLLVGLVLLIFWYSPWFSLIQVCFRKLLQIARKRIHEIRNENLLFHTHILKLFVVEFFVFCFHLLVEAILTDGCWVGGLSCRCITRMFGLVILGLVLNASIVGPFVALSIVALTNIYLCYYNLQMRYRDVKEMISEKWQTLDGKHEHDAIPEDLFWRICSGASNSNNTVPPVRGEVNLMLCNMAIILIFLFLVHCSVFLVTDAKSISAVPSTITVFLSGAIPGLFFKGLTNGKRFTGETRVRMIREIEEAVIDYKENTAVEVGEVNRMLSNMAIILIFLFLVFCSVFLVTDASSMSAVPSTIAVFVSGAIPSLLFKGLTHGKRFTGETRVRMIREIEEAVIKYKENTAVELNNLLQKDTLSNELTLA
ncbi:hypothetical protein pdam_00022952 [Pocillopora damicornis]|uniref:PLAT domain-containing protein n=1 Tax=Pocillopora damicornis TaxID=46731 RepID=A0A3M6V0S4_POCDA|nr:hypothetical protein pdam_00022952 [Pocillopora damicornis]